MTNAYKNVSFTINNPLFFYWKMVYSARYQKKEVKRVCTFNNANIVLGYLQVRFVYNHTWTPYSGSYYLDPGLSLSWHAARDECATYGGFLVSIKSADELDFFNSFKGRRTYCFVKLHVYYLFLCHPL